MKKIDAFVLTNVVLFLLLCVFRYYARFVHYRGAQHIEEFFIYATVILLAIGVLWRVYRHYAFDGATLLALQVGILMHFSGAFVFVNEHRLYDEVLLGVRYDKYVHFINAAAGTLLVCRLFAIQRIALAWVNQIFAVLMVLGLGAVVEIVEYLVVLTVPENGVGGYDNNMQDLMANFAGSCCFMLARGAWQRLAGRASPAARARALPTGG